MPRGRVAQKTICHPERPHLSKGLCKNCYWKQWRDKNKEAQVKFLLKYRYDLTPEKYEEMFNAQGGRCALCREVYKRSRRICVDHNHDTGAIRGLLCDSCNKNVGVYEKWSEKIERYLDEYDEPKN